MGDHWREFLYPLGYLSAIAFGGRFLIQWIASEKKKESVVPVSFWKLSLFGNILLLIHSFIQIQFPICFVQTCNAVISWRNLNLMQPVEAQVKQTKVIGFLFLGIGWITALFAIQGLFLPEGAESWMRVPISFWSKAKDEKIHYFWHILGTAGVLLFNSRFWVQWWLSEKKKTSVLGRPFWWISLAGDLLSLCYFCRIGDFVNMIGPSFGLIPYIRNLMLLNKKPMKSHA